MDTDEDAPELLSALGSEQFLLQAVAGATISEAGTRCMIYLSALSDGLVALGFSGSADGLLIPLAFTVFPTIWVLGCFTIVRLVDTTVENISVKRRIERIRAHYASLGPTAREIFAVEDPVRTGEYGVHYGRASILFSMAAMVGLVNSVLAGAVAALAAAVGLGLATGWSTAAGAAVGLGSFAATIAYDRARVSVVAPGSAPHRTSGAPAKEVRTRVSGS